MKALIIKQKWLDKILAGEKTWEMRGSRTNMRGRIALIQSGSGLIVGECDLVNCLAVDETIFRATQNLHGMKNVEQLPYPKTYAWVLGRAVRYDQPRPYQHPQGAVIWVKL